MKESVGYTVTLNIMIVFITIVVAFLCAALIYFKSNKVSNVVTSAIEKYEGYNEASIKEIGLNLSSLGYSSHSINCDSTVTDKSASGGKCSLLSTASNPAGSKGYCVYKCIDGEYNYYKIRTNMMLNIPIIHDILDIPIYSNTNRLYDFDTALKCGNSCIYNGTCLATC